MNELYSYPTNDYRYYLAHHGVPGMKWGVRRYQNYDGTLTAAGKKHIQSDGKGFGARMKIRGETFVNTHRDIINSTKAAKGIVNKASELVGHGRGETVKRNQMYAQERLKNASNTRLGKHYHDVKGYNAKSFAEYHAIKRGQKIGTRALETVFPATLLKTNIKGITGRKTTLGTEMLAEFIGGAYGNLALNAAYYGNSGYRSNVNRDVDARGKQRYNEAKANYDRSQKEISSGSKKKKG